MATDETLKEQIFNCKQTIEAIEMEVVTLPADVSIAYSTNRPELLQIINRDMTKDEVRAVLDALAGQLRLNFARKELLRFMEQRAEHTVKALEGAAKQIREALYL